MIYDVSAPFTVVAGSINHEIRLQNCFHYHYPSYIHHFLSVGRLILRLKSRFDTVDSWCHLRALDIPWPCDLDLVSFTFRWLQLLLILFNRSCFLCAITLYQTWLGSALLSILKRKPVDGYSTAQTDPQPGYDIHSQPITIGSTVRSIKSVFPSTLGTSCLAITMGVVENGMGYVAPFSLAQPGLVQVAKNGPHRDLARVRVSSKLTDGATTPHQIIVIMYMSVQNKKSE